MLSGVIDYPNLDNGFVVKKAVFSGKAFAEVKISSDKKVISLLPNSVSKTKSDMQANKLEYSADLGAPSVVIKEFKSKGGDGILLTEAELVVSADEGLKVLKTGR